MVRLEGFIAALGLTLALVVSWAPMARVGFGLVGVGFSTTFPLPLSAAGRDSTQASETVFAAVATWGYFGFLVGPPVIGFVADAISLRIALGFVVLSLCACVIRTDRKGKPDQRIETMEHSESLP